MKNTICIVLLVLTHFSVKAQTEKGRWNAGVSIGSFTYQKSDLGRSFSGSISPTAGYFVAKNLLVGTGLPLGHTSQKYGDQANTISSRSTTIGVSPFARYYIGSSKLKPFIGLSYAFSHTNYHSETPQNTTIVSNVKTNSTTLTPSLGLAYFLTPSISIDAQLNYNWYSSKSTFDLPPYDSPKYTNKNVTLGIGFNIFFGG